MFKALGFFKTSLIVDGDGGCPEAAEPGRGSVKRRAAEQGVPGLGPSSVQWSAHRQSSEVHRAQAEWPFADRRSSGVGALEGGLQWLLPVAGGALHQSTVCDIAADAADTPIERLGAVMASPKRGGPGDRRRSGEQHATARPRQ